MEAFLKNLMRFLECIESRLADESPSTPEEHAAHLQRTRLVNCYRDYLFGLVRATSLAAGDRPAEFFPGPLLLQWNHYLSGLLDGYAGSLEQLNLAVESATHPPQYPLPLREIQAARNEIQSTIEEIGAYAEDPAAADPHDEEGRPFCMPLSDEDDRDAMFVHRALDSIHRWREQQRVRAYLFVTSHAQELLNLNTAVGHHNRTRLRYIDPCRGTHDIPDDFR
jgi:hypothetical protein